MGDSCTQVGEPGPSSGRPEGLPRTAAIKQRCGYGSPCKQAESFRIRSTDRQIRSPLLGDGPDYKPRTQTHARHQRPDSNPCVLSPTPTDANASRRLLTGITQIPSRFGKRPTAKGTISLKPGSLPRPPATGRAAWTAAFSKYIKDKCEPRLPIPFSATTGCGAFARACVSERRLGGMHSDQVILRSAHLQPPGLLAALTVVHGV